MAYQLMVIKSNPIKNIDVNWSPSTIGFLLLQKLEAGFLCIEHSSIESA
jgi:hypothetical protein